MIIKNGICDIIALEPKSTTIVSRQNIYTVSVMVELRNMSVLDFILLFPYDTVDHKRVGIFINPGDQLQIPTLKDSFYLRNSFCHDQQLFAEACH